MGVCRCRFAGDTGIAGKEWVHSLALWTRVTGIRQLDLGPILPRGFIFSELRALRVVPGMRFTRRIERHPATDLGEVLLKGQSKPARPFQLA